MLRSEITQIHEVTKAGVYGTQRLGTWTYGNRPDGRSVGCRVRYLPGLVEVYSTWSPAPGQKREECMTQFTQPEWDLLRAEKGEKRKALCDVILSARKYPDVQKILGILLERKRVEDAKVLEEGQASPDS